MKYKKDSLGDRMKGYENETRYYLTGKDPIIIRLDGKAFHTFTKGFNKPFDNILETTMRKTMLYLCENVQGVSFAYTQSDEISLLLTNINKISEYEHWFNGNIQKMASVSASMATMAFNHYFWDEVFEAYWHRYDLEDSPYWCNKPFGRGKDEDDTHLKTAMFDARVFSIPHHEVVNYFIWRQQDAIRNSKQAVGQAHFSQNQLHGKNCDQICEMLKNEKDIDWEDLPIYQQRGTCAEKHNYEYFATMEDGIKLMSYRRSVWEPDLNIPIFTEDRDYVMKHAGPTPKEQEDWEAFWRDL